MKGSRSNRSGGGRRGRLRDGHGATRGVSVKGELPLHLNAGMVQVVNFWTIYLAVTLQ